MLMREKNRPGLLSGDGFVRPECNWPQAARIRGYIQIPGPQSIIMASSPTGKGCGKVMHDFFEKGGRTMKMIRILILLAFAFSNRMAFAGTLLIDKDQERLLNIAYEEGELIGYPETIQGILLQETIAGQLGRMGDYHLGFGKKSYGVMQIRLDTARDMVRRNPELGSYKSDEDLLIRLVTDDEFNIRVGARYFQILMQQHPNAAQGWSRAVSAYNCGSHCGVTSYATKVSSHIRSNVKPFNRLAADNERTVMTSRRLPDFCL